MDHQCLEVTQMQQTGVVRVALAVTLRRPPRTELPALPQDMTLMRPRARMCALMLTWENRNTKHKH